MFLSFFYSCTPFRSVVAHTSIGRQNSFTIFARDVRTRLRLQQFTSMTSRVDRRAGGDARRSARCPACPGDAACDDGMTLFPPSSALNGPKTSTRLPGAEPMVQCPARDPLCPTPLTSVDPSARPVMHRLLEARDSRFCCMMESDSERSSGRSTTSQQAGPSSRACGAAAAVRGRRWAGRLASGVSFVSALLLLALDSSIQQAQAFIPSSPTHRAITGSSSSRYQQQQQSGSLRHGGLRASSSFFGPIPMDDQTSTKQVLDLAEVKVLEQVSKRAVAMARPGGR